ncbi:hypothetical protein D3C71_2044590 [compost metagenome]
MILRRSTSYTAGQNLAAFADKLTKGINVLIVNVSDLVHSEIADLTTFVTAFAAAGKLPLAAVFAAFITLEAHLGSFLSG